MEEGGTKPIPMTPQERIDRAVRQREFSRMFRYTVWYLRTHYAATVPPMPENWKEWWN